MECIVCEDVITQPLCPACVEVEVEAWIGEVKPVLFTEIPTVQNLDWESDTDCIRCHKSFTMCPYCYTLSLLEWINTVAPELKQEFLDYFNFDLCYGGYAYEHRH